MANCIYATPDNDPNELAVTLSAFPHHHEIYELSVKLAEACTNVPAPVALFALENVKQAVAGVCYGGMKNTVVDDALSRRLIDRSVMPKSN